MASRLQYLGVIGQYRKMMEDAIAREQVPRDFHDADQGLLPGAGREIAACRPYAPAELLHARVPRPARASDACSRGARSAGSVKGERRSPRKGISVEFSDYRAYGIGDDLRYVDWNIYARLDRLHVKLFVDEEDLCLHLLVDASASMGFGAPSKLDYAVRLAAALGFVGLVDLERVGVGVLRERMAEGWRPTRGRSQVLPLMDFLAGSSRAARRRSTRGWRTTRCARARRAWPCVVSDLLDPAGYERGLQGAARAALRRPRHPPARPRGDEPRASAATCACSTARPASCATSRSTARPCAAIASGCASSSSARRASAARNEIGYHRVITDTPVEAFVLAPAQGARARMSFLCPFALCCFGALAAAGAAVLPQGAAARAAGARACCSGQAALRDREASTFFQRLQRDPLLILQILALLALTLALARPAVTVMGEGARKVVVVLDTSASMKATRRLALALRRRRSGPRCGLVRRLGEGAEVMVIEAGVQPKVTGAVHARPRPGARPRSARREARDLPNRLAEAVRTARALVGADPRAEIHVFTDGAFTVAPQRRRRRSARALDRGRTARPERRASPASRCARTTSARSTTRRSSRW